MSEPQSAAATAEPEAAVAEPKTSSPRRSRKRQPRYNVILWNNDDHTYDYVDRDAAGAVRPRRENAATRSPRRSTQQGKAIVLTTTKEHAELKRDQIHAYGKDKLIEALQGLDAARRSNRCRS